MRRLLVVIWLSVMLTACSSVEKAAPGTEASAAGLNKPDDLQAPVQTHDLNAIKQKISRHWKELEERHAVKIQMAGVGKDHIMIQLRSAGDVERTVSSAELEAVKKTLFELAGAEFPVQLSVWKCCEREADVTGRITAFDKEQNRILIVNERKKNGNTEDPEATWVTLTPDGIMLAGGSKEASKLDKSLIGREAKAWSKGVVAQSYPSQTSVVKIVVE